MFLCFTNCRNSNTFYPVLGLLAETLTSQLKVMIAGTVLEVIGLTDVLIFLFLYLSSLILLLLC